MGVVVAAGCGPPGPPDVTLFTSPCVTDGSLDAVRPVMPVDYMELRERVVSGSSVTYRVLAASGTQCDTATNPSACNTQFLALPTQPGFHPCYQYDCGHSLAITRGNQLQAFVNVPTLLAFLGPIDTPLEAVLVVYAQGYDLSCVDPSTGGVRVALDGNGFEVLASKVTNHCNPTTITGYDYQVTPDGKLVQLATWPVSSFNNEPCQ